MNAIRSLIDNDVNRQARHMASWVSRSVAFQFAAMIEIVEFLIERGRLIYTEAFSGQMLISITAIVEDQDAVEACLRWPDHNFSFVDFQF